MVIETTPLAGLLVLRPKVFGDERGFFMETYSRKVFHAAGITEEFMQDNHSRSVRGTLRGLHFQSHPGQAKLVRAARGRVWDVAVDIRPASATFGKWHAVELSDEENNMLYIPVGFAHGFCVLSETAEVMYKCSNVYDPVTESGIAWNDPEIGVAWPVKDPIISKRDTGNQSFAQFKAKVGI